MRGSEATDVRMVNGMGKIEEKFADIFRNWNIQLPANATVDKKRGKIRQNDWSISYIYGNDYMDYYAEHRMTNPRHVRIYVDGKVEDLPAPLEMYSYSDESDKERAKQEFVRHNRAIYAELERKGLVDTKDQP